MPDPDSLRRLELMEIPVWVLRRAHPAGSGDGGLAPRIRLEAGTGDWLLVVDSAERSEHARLLDDIRAAIGTSRCRFGQWSDSPEAGIAIDDRRAHGVEYVLAFGRPAAAPGTSDAGVIASASLSELAASARLRRQLWQWLAPHLGS